MMKEILQPPSMEKEGKVFHFDVFLLPSFIFMLIVE